MTESRAITAFYAFVPLEAAELSRLRAELHRFGSERAMEGLVLLAEEGINGTVAGSEQAITEWKAMLIGRFGEMTFKDSRAEKRVFKRWSVKIKPEIVGLKDPNVHPRGKHRHLSPAEWQAMLEGGDAVVVDARNSFEVAVGKFRGAIDPGTESFSEFPEAVQKINIPKDKTVMLYCTGGIRCEKALIAMEKLGYEHVYQLDGGILAYIEQFPNRDFEGECFVFDRRVSVDQALAPSAVYALCPHCGDPGDQNIRCFCGKEQKICSKCMAQEQRKTCSKNCANNVLQPSAYASTR